MGTRLTLAARCRGGAVRGAVLCAMLSLCGAMSHAGQVGSIGGVGRDAVEALQLSDAQKASIDKLVADNREGLASPDAVKVMKARQALLEPMMTPQVVTGSAYRIYFGSRIVDVIRPLVDENNKQRTDQNAINALVIAGETGTQSAAELLAVGIKSASPSIRRAAAYGMQRMFLSLATPPAAMLQPVADQMLVTIQERLTAESDAHVALALVQAGLEASKLRGVNGQFTMGNASIEGVCRALTARASLRGSKALDIVEVQAALNAIGGTRDLVGGRAGVNVPNNVQLAAAELGGSVISHTRRVVIANGLAFDDSQRRELYGQACDAAVTLIGLAGDKLQPGLPVPNPNLGAALRKADKKNDGAFLKGCEDVILVLTKPPFNLDAAKLK